MLKGIVVDDDQITRQLICEIVKHYCEDIEITAEADSVLSGVRTIEKMQPDVVFLDVELPDGKGFDLLNLLFDYTFKVIFISAFKEYESIAMKFNPIDYLVKPISPKHITKAVQKIYHNRLASNIYENKITGLKSTALDKIMIKTASNIFLRLPEQIIRLESEKNHTKVVLKDESCIFSTQSLKSFESRLPSLFSRVHTAHLVNTNYIQYFNKDEQYLIMTDNSKIPVAMRKRELQVQFAYNL
jgi:two-component system LytT family response regulator